MSLEQAQAFVNEARMCDRSQYTDDCIATFPDGTFLPADLVVAMVSALVEAGPDLSFNAKNWVDDGEKVSVDIQVSGTMTNTLAHPMLGDIPATEEFAELDVQRATMTFRDGKVATMTVEADRPAGPFFNELIRLWMGVDLD